MMRVVLKSCAAWQYATVCVAGPELAIASVKAIDRDIPLPIVERCWQTINKHVRSSKAVENLFGVLLCSLN